MLTAHSLPYGGSLSHTPHDRDPPDRDPMDRPTPNRDPRTDTPHRGQTPVKTLPSQTWFAGGNKVNFLPSNKDYGCCLQLIRTVCL